MKRIPRALTLKKRGRLINRRGLFTRGTRVGVSEVMIYFERCAMPPMSGRHHLGYTRHIFYTLVIIIWGAVLGGRGRVWNK